LLPCQLRPDRLLKPRPPLLPREVRAADLSSPHREAHNFVPPLHHALQVSSSPAPAARPLAGPSFNGSTIDSFFFSTKSFLYPLSYPPHHPDHPFLKPRPPGSFNSCPRVSILSIAHHIPYFFSRSCCSVQCSNRTVLFSRRSIPLLLGDVPGLPPGPTPSF